MIRFYENRYKFFAISTLIIIIGIVFMFTKGIKLDIQFKGGAILKYTYVGTIDTKSVEKLINKTIERNSTVQTIRDIATGEYKLVINMAGNKNLSIKDQKALEKSLFENFAENKLALSSTNTVEPFIGKRFLKNGLIAIAISSILIVIYVWIRFKSISGLSAGVMALIALLHDCIIVFFSFVILGIPINELFVAVILTIIGYSVNDTIIIYDRIRENSRINKKMPLYELVNTSITQTMSRSVNTCCTTLASAIIVSVFAYIYGIDGVYNFSIPMAIGLISGCYSTICLAGPLWVMWQNHKTKTNVRSSNKKALQA